MLDEELVPQFILHAHFHIDHRARSQPTFVPEESRAMRRSRFELLMRELLCSLTRFLVGAYPSGERQGGRAQRLYFANHTSHLDTLTLLASLPLRARSRTRPVAARDYWCKGPVRRWVAERLLNVVFIDRVRKEGEDPLVPLRQALSEGYSLILFPEGTRRDTELPGEFKSGLYFLAQDFAALQLTPVYLENLHRILPKGSLLPVPLINRVHFGAPLERLDEEPKTSFLTRARDAVCALCPGH